MRQRSSPRNSGASGSDGESSLQQMCRNGEPACRSLALPLSWIMRKRVGLSVAQNFSPAPQDHFLPFAFLLLTLKPDTLKSVLCRAIEQSAGAKSLGDTNYIG